MSSRAPTLWRIVEKHLDEATILWLQWTRALVSPDYSLDEVERGPEERLRAQLAGLLEAGPECADRLLVPALGDPQPHRVAAAALSLLSGEGGLDRLVPPLRGAADDVVAAVAPVLGLADGPGLDAGLAALVREDVPALQAAAIDALAVRGRVPAELRALLASPAPQVQAAALRAAPVAGLAHRPALEGALRSPEPAVRNAALIAGLSLGLRAPWLEARRLAGARAPGCGPALCALALSAEPADLTPLEAALAIDELRADALWALGFSGWPRAVELCLPYLDDEVHGRVAGEAVTAITGLALEGDYAREEPPPPEEPIPFEDEDLEADLVPGPEATLPLPDGEVIALWWERARERFAPERRWLGGQPLTPDALLRALGTAPMRRRGVLALELAARTQGALRVETRAWASAQRAALQAARLEPSAASAASAGSFERALRG